VRIVEHANPSGDTHPQHAASSFLRYFQQPEVDPLSSDFWDLARKLGNSVQHYTEALLHGAAHANPALADKIHDFKGTMEKAVSSTMELRAQVQSGAEWHGLTLENVSEMLSTELATVMEELKAEFPAPSEAGHHEERVEMISRALVKVEGCVVRVSARCGVSEAVARAHFRNIEPHVQHVLIVTGKNIYYQSSW
jgi:hypothetical protein